jgi:hypothetical protein
MEDLQETETCGCKEQTLSKELPNLALRLSG